MDIVRIDNLPYAPTEDISSVGRFQGELSVLDQLRSRSDVMAISLGRWAKRPGSANKVGVSIDNHLLESDGHGVIAVIRSYGLDEQTFAIFDSLDANGYRTVELAVREDESWRTCQTIASNGPLEQFESEDQNLPFEVGYDSESKMVMLSRTALGTDGSSEVFFRNDELPPPMREITQFGIISGEVIAPDAA